MLIFVKKCEDLYIDSRKMFDDGGGGGKKSQKRCEIIFELPLIKQTWGILTGF